MSAVKIVSRKYKYMSFRLPSITVEPQRRPAFCDVTLQTESVCLSFTAFVA